MFESMLEQAKEFFRVIQKDDEFFKIYAGLVKKAVDALIAEGFARDEAIKMVSGQGFGMTSKNS